VQVPLDYYRILGVPIQVTPEQLQQAYEDRAQQLPRYHYSQAAIAARKELLETAYTVLFHPEQRRLYDAAFLAKTYPAQDSQTPEPEAGGSETRVLQMTSPKTSGIEIPDHQLTGALLLLQELGEYELVLQLGTPYLRSGILDLKHQRSGSVLSEADIVLTVALVDLELGREQWQQGQHEKAAQSLQAGLELLLREGLFSDIQSEMRADLYKLRPYRVLELLAAEDDSAERSRGLSLLQDMLEERGGIDGTGNDHSGLNINEFLRFIQQLRGYLCVTEQQELFEKEASRPSAVAAYLAVYALVAQGYVQKQPALIRRAKAMLMRLSTHQEVYLEQAVCALLLGQQEAANQTLELSHEYESLAFIREYSADSPDLIPGLCLYTERWLQEEVFPYFRDLVGQQVHLNDYFNDKQVQAYLEELLAETTPAMSTVRAEVRAASPNVSGSSLQPAATGPMFRTGAAQGGAVGTLDKTGQPYPQQQVLTAPSQLPVAAAERPLTTAIVPASSAASSPQAPRTSKGWAILSPRKGRVANRPHIRKPARRSRPESAGRRRQTQIGLILLSLLVVGTLTAAIAYGLRELLSPGPSEPEAQSPRVQQLPAPTPAPSSRAAAPSRPQAATGNAPLNQEGVRQLVQSWQSTKAAALGPQRTTKQLAQVLTGPALATWQNRAQEAKTSNSYWEYKLNRLNINAVEVVNPNQVRAEVTLNETANFFEGGQPRSAPSYTDTYRVRYTLVRQDRKWLIQDMEVL